MKFTANLNLRMNYWPAEATGLPECLEPLLRMVKELAETGSKVARVRCGARGRVWLDSRSVVFDQACITVAISISNGLVANLEAHESPFTKVRKGDFHVIRRAAGEAVEP